MTFEIGVIDRRRYGEMLTSRFYYAAAAASADEGDDQPHLAEMDISRSRLETEEIHRSTTLAAAAEIDSLNIHCARVHLDHDDVALFGGARVDSN
jgi:hypothetical protein